MLVLDKKLKRVIAEAAPCDRRTLDRVIRGRSVRGKAADRARCALAAAGFDPPDGEGSEPGARLRRRGRGMAPRTLPVVEIVGLLPGELGGATRLFAAVALLSRLAEAQTRWAGSPEVVRVMTVLDALAELRHGNSARELDAQNVAAEVFGVRFVAGQDGRGALLLQLEDEVVTTLAGAALDVQEEIEINRAALAANLVAAAAASHRGKA